MKILLAIMISAAMTSSAYAVCGKTTLGDCKNKTDCEALSSDKSTKYTFDDKAKQCLFKDVVANPTTNCISGLDSTKPKDTNKGDAAKADATKEAGK